MTASHSLACHPVSTGRQARGRQALAGGVAGSELAAAGWRACLAGKRLTVNTMV